MPHYGVLHEYRFEGNVDDVRGADVYGVNDEKLGTIDDVIFDHASGEIRYVILNTGGLLARKRVLVPASRIQPYGSHDDKFYAELDKDRLAMLPEFNTDMLKSEFNWASYDEEYQKRWNDGTVMYNKDTGRIITPPMEEVAGGRAAPLGPEGRESLNRNLTPERRGKQDDLLGVASGTAKTTLQPQKASTAGKSDVPPAREKPAGEVMSPMGSEIEIPRESRRPPLSESLREPRVYKVGEAIDQPLSGGELGVADKGRRWSGFQQGLRERRQKIVVDCPLCASQEKVA